MKKFRFFFTLFVIIINDYSCANAQKNDSDSQSIKMLSTFYSEYNSAWSSTKGKILLKRLDSLQRIYCTSKLRNLQHKEDEHDLIINDQYTDIKHLKTLTVKKNTAKPNAFIVSYIAPTRNASNEPIEVKVVINVVVAKEQGALKIASTDMSL